MWNATFEPRLNSVQFQFSFISEIILQKLQLAKPSRGEQCEHVYYKINKMYKSKGFKFYINYEYIDTFTRIKERF